MQWWVWCTSLHYIHDTAASLSFCIPLFCNTALGPVSLIISIHVCSASALKAALSLWPSALQRQLEGHPDCLVKSLINRIFIFLVMLTTGLQRPHTVTALWFNSRDSEKEIAQDLGNFEPGNHNWLSVWPSKCHWTALHSRYNNTCHPYLRSVVRVKWYHVSCIMSELYKLYMDI